MGNKKNKALPPRHKRLKRDGRLNAAKTWIQTYTGKNLVKGYSKHFAVDLLCAVFELEKLGHSINEEYKQQLKNSIEARIKNKQQRKALKEQQEQFTDSDSYFYYIAGYTSNGVPYGVTWEEMGMEPFGNYDDIDIFD